MISSISIYGTPPAFSMFKAKYQLLKNYCSQSFKQGNLEFKSRICLVPIYFHECLNRPFHFPLGMAL